MPANPLAALVRAIATSYVQHCTRCTNGVRSIYNWQTEQFDHSPCPVCGDVRRALAALDAEQGGEVGG